jgi:hypothetical protein
VGKKQPLLIQQRRGSFAAAACENGLEMIGLGLDDGTGTGMEWNGNCSPSHGVGCACLDCSGIGVKKRGNGPRRPPLKKHGGRVEEL